MVKIIFESHGTTYDNEAKKSSGHFDVSLSPLGIKQSEELGKRYAHEQIDAIFCSDLERSFKTADIAFSNSNIPIIKDTRLRECDYGDLTRQDSSLVEDEKIKHISIPFSNGESYEDTNQRMKSFLKDLLNKYNGKKVLIIGHRATQYGLETYINNRNLEEILSEKFKWQPGWTYELSSI